MSELVFDLVEDILVRLDAVDLIRCKSVCKSWLSLISASRFAKTHLNYTCNKDHNNNELGHIRIIIPSQDNTLNYATTLDLNEYYSMDRCIIGSSNGLVCFSVSFANGKILVTNPLTGEVKKLQTVPGISIRLSACWGFGYDSFTDDYKVITGIKVHKVGTLFQVLTLKSNIWKVKRLVKLKFIGVPIGILLNGALHWFMKVSDTKRQVIISFDLSREEFTEIPQPDDSQYRYDYLNFLGIAEKCLCIYRSYHPYQRWIMRKYNDKQSWELLPLDCEMNKYDVAYMLKCSGTPNTWYNGDEDGRCFSRTGKYIGCPIYVRSIVSPHLDGKPKKKKRPTKNNNKRSVNRVSNYDVISRCYFFSIVLEISINEIKGGERDIVAMKLDSTVTASGGSAAVWSNDDEDDDDDDDDELVMVVRNLL
ncbi:putative F-box domain-containing protein [Tanacetum coccineum]